MVLWKRSRPQPEDHYFHKVIYIYIYLVYIFFSKIDLLGNHCGDNTGIGRERERDIYIYYHTISIYILSYFLSWTPKQFNQNCSSHQPADLPGQAGTPHPQAPTCKKARMYKVLKEISEEVIHGQRADSSLSVGGRVRSAEMKAMLAKQLGQGLQSLEGATLVDMKTGRIASKKEKKEKTKEQLALDELKKLKTKFLGSIWFSWY